MCAEKLGKQVSGGFQQIIQSAVKYDFITRKKGSLATTPLFKEIKLAYNEDEKKKLQQRAFLNVPLFKKLCERFNSHKIPIQHFDKLLMREYGVNDNMASRIKKHFIDGAKETGLMSPDNKITLDNEPCETSDNNNFQSTENIQRKNEALSSKSSYTIKIDGPGINSVVSITDESDLAIANFILQKIEEKLKTKQEAKTESHD
ncbi:MAG: hypothetical protein KAI59_01935 [Planctomycetes bacterium]|nr:hypothetical protein [Planctomycetota bacterium]